MKHRAVSLRQLSFLSERGWKCVIASCIHCTTIVALSWTSRILQRLKIYRLIDDGGVANEAWHV